MMDSMGELKDAEDKHPLRRQICPVHMDETFSDTTIKLQSLSLTLDDSSFLQEMTSHIRLQIVLSSNVIVGRYRWIVIWMQLRRGII
jgi:hypothetical protein